MICPFCYNGHGVVKFSKRGKPYFSCPSCLSRLFLNTREGLQGFAVLEQVVSSLTAEERNLLMLKVANSTVMHVQGVQTYIEKEKAKEYAKC